MSEELVKVVKHRGRGKGGGRRPGQPNKGRGKGVKNKVTNRTRLLCKPQEELFAKMYVYETGLNARRATLRAGYANPTHAYDLIRRPCIRALISKLLDQEKMGKDEVHVKLSEHAHASLEDFYDIEIIKDKSGNPILNEAGEPRSVMVFNPLKAQKAGKLHLLRKVKETKFGMEVEPVDQQAALEKIGRIHAMFNDKLQITPTVSGEEIFERMREAVVARPLLAERVRK